MCCFGNIRTAVGKCLVLEQLLNWTESNWTSMRLAIQHSHKPYGWKADQLNVGMLIWYLIRSSLII